MKQKALSKSIHECVWAFNNFISEFECLENNFRQQLIETYDLRIISNIVYDSTADDIRSDSNSKRH